MAETTRKSILAEAEKCVCTDREKQYGSPEDNFKAIALLWNAYVVSRRDSTTRIFDAQDVAIMMALLKIGRIACGQTKADNYVDLCGYAACAGEIALGED